MNGFIDTIMGRPKTVLTIMIVMVVAGILTYISIPKEANPDIDVPVYLVNLSQQGVSPRDAERLLARPMETQLRGLDGLKEITAIASEGGARIILEFEVGSDKDTILADIRDKVDQAKAELPAEADEPGVFETNLALEPTIIITLSGNVPERTLFNQAKRLQDQIEAISSVREATLNGSREEVLEVILDLDRLESYNITQQELLTALSNNNQLVPAGFLDDGNARFNLKVPGLVENAQDVYTIPIKQNDEGVVTLNEVAEIRRTFKDASSYTRVNGEPAISLEVVKRIGTNIIENNQEVRKVVEEATKDWPSTIKVNYLIDQSSFIFEVLGSLQSSILTAIALVMIVVVASLGVRSGMLVGLAIPTSFMVGFLILSAAGLTVNMMVMFGLVLTVGMLVDGAIVVTEYADRKMGEGMPADEAYPRAAKLMFWPVISSTATTLAAFLPLLLWPGVPGEFMSYLPIMVIIVLSASLMTALIFMPTAGIVLAKTGDLFAKYGRVIMALAVGGLAGLFAYQSMGENGVLVGSILQFAIPAVVGVVAALFAAIIFGLMGKARARKAQEPENEVAQMLTAARPLDVKKVPGFLGDYLFLLKGMTSNIFGNLIVIAAILALTFGTFVTFGQNSKGVEFFVEEEPDLATLLISARGNLSGQDIRDLAIEVENEVLQVRGIDNVVMTATAPGGGSSGRFSPNGPQDVPADNIAIMQIELADYSKRRPATEIFEEIRTRTGTLAGIKVEIRKVEGGPPTGKDIRLQVKSTDYDQLVEVVSQLRPQFDALDGLQDLEDGRPLPSIEWELAVNREEAGRYNASIPAIGSMIQLVTNGVLIGKYRPGDTDDEVDIRVRLPEEQRSLAVLEDLKLPTQNGQVPLANFVTMTPQQKVASITRRDGLYSMDIKANLTQAAKDAGVTPDDKVAEIQQILDNGDWPSNIFFKFRGADEEQKESGEFLGKAAAGSLFLMFIILVTQYNSFYQSFLTLSTVILAIVGVLIGMLITGQKFSIIMTGTGVIALAGIVVNNAIILIDTYNRLRAEGVDVHQAVLKTAAQRLRPITLTTVTTILGLIPMALAINVDFINQQIVMGSITAIWWIQLSTAIISGLAFSTILTLIMIPVMLSLPANLMQVGGVFARLFKTMSIDPHGKMAMATAGAATGTAGNARFPWQMPKQIDVPAAVSARETMPPVVDQDTAQSVNDVIRTEPIVLPEPANQSAEVKDAEKKSAPKGKSPKRQKKKDRKDDKPEEPKSYPEAAE